MLDYLIQMNYCYSIRQSVVTAYLQDSAEQQTATAKRIHMILLRVLMILLKGNGDLTRRLII